MTLINIFILILIILASSMCVYVIYYMKRIFEHVEAVSLDIHLVIENMQPILSDLEDISGSVKKIVIEAGEYWAEIDSSLKNLHQNLSKLKYLKIFRVGFTPTSEIINNLKPISKGISAFWSKYKHV